jgi:hypothetical protein
VEGKPLDSKPQKALVSILGGGDRFYILPLDGRNEMVFSVFLFFQFCELYERTDFNERSRQMDAHMYALTSP